MRARGWNSIGELIRAHDAALALAYQPIHLTTLKAGTVIDSVKIGTWERYSTPISISIDIHDDES